MIFSLVDGRTDAWQWDSGLSLNVDMSEHQISEVHMSNSATKGAFVCEIKADGTVEIPNILLTTSGDINLYAIIVDGNGDRTIFKERLHVHAKKKPQDYVYTETEVYEYKDYIARLEAVENSTIEAGNVTTLEPGSKAAVSTRVIVNEDGSKTYLLDFAIPDGANGKSAYETAVEGGFEGTEEEFAEMLANAGTGGGGIVNETDPTVPSWAKQPQKPTYTASEVGAVGAQQLPQAINTALAQAKASGDFDGKDGSNGADGVSPTVTTSKSGKVTTIKITDKNGTKTATINDGADGANGTNGTNGKDGTSVTITKITESSASGGANTVTFSDGKTLSIKNGKDGKDGEGGSGGIGNDPIVIGDSDGQHTKVDIGSITLAEGEEYHVKMTGSTTDDLDECLLLEGKSGTDVQLRGLLAPTANNDAATKAYVDGKATKSGVGLSNVDNVKQYSASNPPPYPVKSVNGKTGAVTVTVPTKMSELENDRDYAQLDDIPAPEVYVGDGAMPGSATLQIIVDEDEVIPGYSLQAVVDAVLAALPTWQGGSY